MTHVDLFSGIGGFALAASWCGIETIQFVEIDPFCQKVLQKNFPGVPIHDDIKTFHWTGERPFILTGGFPCQPFSVAGKRKGKADDRYLWPEMLRVIQEARATWIVGENVAGIIKMDIDQVLSDLERVQYEVQAIVIPACAVDAPHRRDRVWFIAHSASDGCRCGEGNAGCDLEGTISTNTKQPRDRWSSEVGEMSKKFNDSNPGIFPLHSTLFPKDSGTQKRRGRIVPVVQK